MQKIIYIIIVIIVLGFGLWFFGGQTNTSIEDDTVAVEKEPFIDGNEIIIDESKDTTDSQSVVGDDASIVVLYTDAGFEPKEMTIPVGTKITFQNDSSGGMWVASAVHPIHNKYPEFDQLQSVSNGETYSFMFDKKGEWKYHNHVNAFKTGIIIVQ